METKISYLKAATYDFLYRLKDIRFAGQVVFVIVVLLISWSGVKAIQANYSLEKKIATAKQENNVQQLENNDLKLQNEYYNSQQYLEVQARLNFGLGMPGEQEILVPQSVAMSYAPKVSLPSNDPNKVSEPAYQKHIQSWVNFLLHHS